MSRPIMLGSEIFRHSRYGSKHPLAIARVSSVVDLCRALGWLPAAQFRDVAPASPADLARFHDADYIAALQQAERDQALPADLRTRYNLGGVENPVFGEIFRRPATAAAASMLGARLAWEGQAVFSPAGGTHHGRTDRASGFCYVNDPVLALLTLLDMGARRVVYLDLDAHRADGVEIALAGEPRVRIISIHEAGRWPDGRVDCPPGALNLALPRGAGDAPWREIFLDKAEPAALDFDPEIIVLQFGADALADDPLSRLVLSNTTLLWALRRVIGWQRRLLVLGGGGYNPWSVARLWTGAWAILNGYRVPEILPEAAQAVLRPLHWPRLRSPAPPAHWITTLADAPLSPAREVA